MPAFLEKKLKKEYGNDPHAIYGTLNKIGAMHGNKETKKGKVMEKKHAMATKMHAAIKDASIKGKKKRYERTLDNFVKHGREKEQNKAWEYARENRMSDKRMF